MNTIQEPREEEIRNAGSELLDEVLDERYGIVGKHHPPEDVPLWFVNRINALLTTTRTEALEEVIRVVEKEYIRYPDTGTVQESEYNYALLNAVNSLKTLTSLSPTKDATSLETK